MKKTSYLLNIDRINFLIDFYKITKDNFLKIINGDNKKRITFSELENPIELSKIKKIDKVFQKGLSWYIDKNKIIKKEDKSIFFRKNLFNSNLELEDIKIINNFEEKKFLLNNLCNNIEFKLKRNIDTFNINDKIEKVVEIVNNKFFDIENDLIERKIIKKINFENTKEKDKEYLKNLFRIIEEFGVFVFEYLENHNKKQKVNFEGFYLKNIIVVKRNKNLRKEIFTLLHEFAHFLLDKEEIDENLENENLSKIERWCNDFAFSFLIFNEKKSFKKLENPNLNNDFYKNEIIDLSKKTYLNPISFYVNFLYLNKINSNVFITKRDEINKNHQKRLLKEKEEFDKQIKFKKVNGEKIPPMIPKSIKSKLFEEIVSINFSQGKIDDGVDLCRYLEFSKKKSEKFMRNLYE